MGEGYEGGRGEDIEKAWERKGLREEDEEEEGRERAGRGGRSRVSRGGRKGVTRINFLLGG